MADIKINYTAGIDSDFAGNAGSSPKERVTEIFNCINSSLSSPYYTSKVLKEYQDEVLQIMETLEKRAVTSEILNRDITQSEFLDKAEKIIEEKSPELKIVWLVLSHDDQSNYTEPKYWDTARDSSDIVGIYSNEKAAREVVEKLKKEEEKRLASLSEDYEEEWTRGKYYTIQRRELKYEAEYPSSEKIVTVGYYVPEKPEWREDEKGAR